MSIPCTYPHNDWLMYLLYTGDAPFMAQVIRAAMANIRRAHAGSEPVADAVGLYEPGPADSLHTLRAKLLVLLDQVAAARPARPGRAQAEPPPRRTRTRAASCASSARSWRGTGSRCAG